MKPFSTAFLQVMFVCANTLMIAKLFYPGVIICSFCISLLWTFNVRSALGNWKERLLYCLGATLGSVTGLYLSSEIVKFYVL